MNVVVVVAGVTGNRSQRLLQHCRESVSINVTVSTWHLYAPLVTSLCCC